MNEHMISELGGRSRVWKKILLWIGDRKRDHKHAQRAAKEMKVFADVLRERGLDQEFIEAAEEARRRLEGRE